LWIFALIDWYYHLNYDSPVDYFFDRKQLLKGEMAASVEPFYCLSCMSMMIFFFLLYSNEKLVPQ